MSSSRRGLNYVDLIVLLAALLAGLSIGLGIIASIDNSVRTYRPTPAPSRQIPSAPLHSPDR